MYSKLYKLDPKPEDLAMDRLKTFKKMFEDLIRICCIKLEWSVVGSERLYVSGDSWFSAKTI